MTPANHDLRAWLSEIEKIGQLRRIQGVPWDKDMGGLVEMILERGNMRRRCSSKKFPTRART